MEKTPIEKITIRLEKLEIRAEKKHQLIALINREIEELENKIIECDSLQNAPIDIRERYTARKREIQDLIQDVQILNAKIDSILFCMDTIQGI